MAMTGPGRRVGMDLDALRCLDRLADRARAELGVEVRMISGLRLRSEQAYLRWGWEQRQKYPNDPRYRHFNFAALPGTSNHESGYACDIDPDLAEDPRLRSIAAECGLVLSVRWANGTVREWWHLEPAWRHGGARPAFLDATPAPPAPIPQEDDDMLTDTDRTWIAEQIAAAAAEVKKEVVVRARNTNGATVVELPDGSLAVTGVDRDGPWLAPIPANPDVIGALTAVRAIEPATVPAGKLTEGQANALNGFRP